MKNSNITACKKCGQPLEEWEIEICEGCGMSINLGDKIAVWFSCGAASAVAAKKTLEKYGDVCTVRVINNPVAGEYCEEGDEPTVHRASELRSWDGMTICDDPYCVCSVKLKPGWLARQMAEVRKDCENWPKCLDGLRTLNAELMRK
jgi:hypothetical protein